MRGLSGFFGGADPASVMRHGRARAERGGGISGR